MPLHVGSGPGPCARHPLRLQPPELDFPRDIQFKLMLSATNLNEKRRERKLDQKKTTKP